MTPAGALLAEWLGDEVYSIALFVDLRTLRQESVLPPISMRISGYGPPSTPYGNDLVPDLTKAFDAVFYIDRMAPATMLK
jgi:hypothetical protein